MKKSYIQTYFGSVGIQCVLTLFNFFLKKSHLDVQFKFILIFILFYIKDVIKKKKLEVMHFNVTYSFFFLSYTHCLVEVMYFLL